MNENVLSRESLILEFPDVDVDYVDFLIARFVDQEKDVLKVENSPESRENGVLKNPRSERTALQKTREKLVAHCGHYPKRPQATLTESHLHRRSRRRWQLHHRQTHWFRTLAEMFPELHHEELRDTIRRETRHAFSLTDIIDHLLKLVSEEEDNGNGHGKDVFDFRRLWFRQRKRLRTIGMGNVADSEDTVFHGEQYDQQAQSLLYTEFRLWKPVLKSILAEAGSYRIARVRIAQLRGNHPWLFSLAAGFLGYLQSADPPIEDADLDDDLRAELEVVRIQRLHEQANQDEAVALELNRKQYNQLLECRCCFGDFVIEEMVQCSDDGHLICRQCVEHYLREVLYGALIPTDRQNRGCVPCLAARTSDSSPCCGNIKRHELIRILGKDLLERYDRWVCDLDLQDSGVEVLRCAHCQNAEFFDATDVERLRTELRIPKQTWFVSFISARQSAARLRPRWHPQVVLACRKLLVTLREDTRVISLLFMFLLTRFNPVVLFLLAIYFFIAYVPIRELPNLTNQLINAVRNTSLSFLKQSLLPADIRTQLPIKRFLCSSCKRSTCLKCNQEWIGQHRECAVDREQDQYRLFIERAMTNAVVRSCPGCGANLMKSDGCNKLVCKCGRSICYICREDLKSAGYSHFCQHFRSVPGSNCQKCSKCDLWKSPDEALAVEAAAQQAHEEWTRMHPESAA